MYFCCLLCVNWSYCLKAVFFLANQNMFLLNYSQLLQFIIIIKNVYIIEEQHHSQVLFTHYQGSSPLKTEEPQIPASFDIQNYISSTKATSAYPSTTNTVNPTIVLLQHNRGKHPWFWVVPYVGYGWNCHEIRWPHCEVWTKFWMYVSGIESQVTLAGRLIGLLLYVCQHGLTSSKQLRLDPFD